MEAKDWSEAAGKLVKLCDTVAFVAADLSKNEKLKGITHPLIGFLFDEGHIVGWRWRLDGRNRNDSYRGCDIVRYANDQEVESFKKDLLNYSLSFARNFGVPVTWDNAEYESQKIILKGDDGSYIFESEEGIGKIEPEEIKNLKFLWGRGFTNSPVIKNALSGKFLKDGSKRVCMVACDLSNFDLLSGFPKSIIGASFNVNGSVCVELYLPNGQKELRGFEESKISGYATSEEMDEVVKAISDFAIRMAYESQSFITWSGTNKSYRIVGVSPNREYIYSDDGKIGFVNPDEVTGLCITKWSN
jgi:hypothetical protein